MKRRRGEEEEERVPSYLHLSRWFQYLFHTRLWNLPRRGNLAPYDMVFKLCTQEKEDMIYNIVATSIKECSSLYTERVPLLFYNTIQNGKQNVPWFYFPAQLRILMRQLHDFFVSAFKGSRDLALYILWMGFSERSAFELKSASRCILSTASYMKRFYIPNKRNAAHWANEENPVPWGEELLEKIIKSTFFS